MKRASDRTSGFYELAILICLGFAFIGRAQPQLTPAQAAALAPLAPKAVPDVGTFWSLQKYGSWPALPYVPVEGLDVFRLPDGSFLFDDLDVDYAALREQAEMERALLMLDGLDTPDPGDPSFTEDYPTNSLWLEITNVLTTASNKLACLIVHGTVQNVLYEVLSKEPLGNTAWASETSIVGAADQDWTPATVVVGSRTNALFLWARSWIDSYGIGIPDWWQLVWFGKTGIDPYDDPDGDGWTNVQEYQNGTAPTSFDTPPAPTGLTVWYNGSTIHVTAAWNHSGGPVQYYTIERYIPELQSVDYFTNGPTDEVFDDEPFPLETLDAQFLPPSYRVQAHYGGGASEWSDPVELTQPDFAANIVRGPGGHVFAVVPALSSATATIRLSRFDYNVPWPDPPTITNIDIARNQFVNGIYQIPDQLAGVLGRGYTWRIQALDGSGVPASTLGIAYNVANLPFFDGRQQLQANLVFLLRAAFPDIPFWFRIIDGQYDPLYSQPDEYAYASLFDAYTWQGANYVVLNEFFPFHHNSLYRNFVFSPEDLDSQGVLDTGIDVDNANNISLYYPPKYYFSPPSSVGPITPTLSLTNSQYLWYFNPLSDFGRSTIGITSPDNVHYFMATGVTNHFGLGYVAARQAYQTNNTIAFDVLNAGGSVPRFGEFYPQTAEPQVNTVDYYFCRARLPATFSSDPFPGHPGFSASASTPLLIAPVGETFRLAAFARQTVLNGDRMKTACLGQYFDKAYRANLDGSRTTNETGILSEYGEFFPTEPGPAVLTTKPDLTQTNNLQGECTVHAIKLQLDVNHDGIMDLSFAGPDNTSAGKPFVFWLNNDCDFTDNSSKPGDEVNYYARDGMDDFINSRRDLEDLARLQICGVPALPANAGWEVTLGWSTVSSGTPTIRLFSSVEVNGDVGYLTDTNVALTQVSSTGPFTGPKWALAAISPGRSYTFPPYVFTNSGNKCFLFEAAGTNGSGQLTLSITQGGTNIAEASAWLDLHDVKDLYERAITTNTFQGSVSNWSSILRTVERPTVREDPDDEDIIIYVHGASNTPGSWLQRSDTLYKRLYWAGYRGKFASVRWDSMFIADPSWFNLSELYAYKASSALRAYLSQLRSRFSNCRLHIFAHSQGGAIASEALSGGASFDTLILSQAAMPASCYDVNAPTNSDLLYRETNVARTPDWQPMGYHGAHTNIAGRIVNFYNVSDDLLSAWLLNQKFFKPTQFYVYDGTNGWYYFDPENNGRRLLSDSQESRAQLARSRTLGIGVQGPASGQTNQGIIESTVNLRTQLNIGQSQAEHSAFFSRPIQTSWPFYDQILESCFIPTVPR